MAVGHQAQGAGNPAVTAWTHSGISVAL